MASSKGPHSSPSVASVSYPEEQESESVRGLVKCERRAGKTGGKKRRKREMMARTHRVNHNLHAGPRVPEGLQQVDVLPVGQDEVDVGELEDVADVVGLEAVVDGDDDGAGGDDAVDGLEEGRGVSHEHADALVAVGPEVVGQAAGAVGELLVGAAQAGAVGGDVDDGLGMGLDGGGAGEEGGRGEGVEVVGVLVRRACLGGGGGKGGGGRGGRGGRGGGGGRSGHGRGRPQVVEDGPQSGGCIGHGALVLDWWRGS